MNYLYKKIKKKNIFSAVLLLWLLFTPLQVFLWFIYSIVLKKQDIMFYAPPEDMFDGLPLIGMIVPVVFIGPFIETIFCQALIYHLLILVRWFRRHRYMIIILGGVAFGLAHFFTLSYIIFSTITGCLLMFAYVIRQGDKNLFSGYFVTSILHGLINLNAIVIGEILP